MTRRTGGRLGWARAATILLLVQLLVLLALPAPARADDADTRPFEDPTIRVDEDGRRFAVDPAPPPPSPDARKRVAEAVAAAPTVALAGTFELHSLPGSKHTIFLDFDGGVITGTVWNGYDADESGPGGPTPSNFTAVPFSLDATVSTAFSSAELAAIQSIWLRVSEDYAPFDVDVTTQDPGLAAINRTGSGDLVFGTTAMISNTPFIGDDCECGGLAFIDVFDHWSLTPQNHQYYQPAWIFPKNLSFDAKYIGEAVSHEVGHNLGLDHDGRDAPGTVNDLSYYQGHGPWAPIMGTAYYRPVSQWSKGEYQFPNNLEDDLAVIASVIGTVPDDHGNTTGTAKPLPGTGPYAATGLISTDADADWFTVTVPAGDVSFTAQPATYAPDLDIGLELRTASTLLDGDNPPVAYVSEDVASGLGATVSANVPAGTYFVKVEGVGTGNAFTGYSGYGSLGRYTLTGAFSSPADRAQLVYGAVEPCAVYDSRTGTGGFAGMHKVGQTRTVQVTGSIPVAQGGEAACAVPAGASAAFVNVIAINATQEGQVRAYAGGGSPPDETVVSFASLTGQKLNTANAVAVPLSATGGLAVNVSCGTPTCVSTPATSVTHIRVVVLGYFTDDLAARVTALEAAVNEGSPGATDGSHLAYASVEPCAVYDSRDGTGGFAGMHAVGEARVVQVTGPVPVAQGGETDCAVPGGSSAALVNVEAIDAAQEGNVRVYAGGGSPPNGGVLNFAPLTGQKLNTANAVAVPLSGTGALAVNVNCGTATCVATPSTPVTHIRVVVVGYFTDDLVARVAALEAVVDEGPPGATDGAQLVYGAVEPCAVYDSRTGTGAFAGLHTVGETRTVQVTGPIPAAQGGQTACAVPAGASAAFVNVIAINATQEGNARVYAGGGSPPNGGVVNFASLTGQKLNTANAVAVPLSGSGTLAVNVNCGTATCVATPTTPVTHIRVVVVGYFTDDLAARVAALEAAV